MTDYDSPWKEALDVYFQPFMQFCFPTLADAIDWSVVPKMLDKELMQIAPQSELRPLYRRGLTAEVVRKLFRVLD